MPPQLLALSLVLSACALPPFETPVRLGLPELNNVEADEHEKLAKDPELAWRLEILKAPHDDNWHFGANVKRLHDRETAAPIGWYFSFNARHAIPFTQVRPSHFDALYSHGLLPFVVRPTPTPAGTPEPELPRIIVHAGP